MIWENKLTHTGKYNGNNNSKLFAMKNKKLTLNIDQKTED